MFQYVSIDNGRPTQRKIEPNCIVEVCSLTRPVALKGVMTIGPADFDVWRGYHGSGFLGVLSGWAIEWQNPFNNFNFDGFLGKKPPDFTHPSFLSFEML